jgi:hypothetical protein
LRYAWIVLFVPTSSLLAGILAYLMSLSAPGSGGNGLSDVIRGYAPFWPGTYGVRHIPSLILSLAVLFLLDVSRRARKPIVTLFQIRVILLVLIALLTIVFKVFSVVWPLDVASRATMEEAQALFIYADLDLCLIFLLTFLPAFRRSPSRLI